MLRGLRGLGSIQGVQGHCGMESVEGDWVIGA